MMAFGLLVTYAEPAINALLMLSAVVDAQQSPYLYFLLHSWSELLVFCIGLGMGSAAVLGSVRLIYGWPLRWLISAITGIAMLFTAYLTWFRPHLSGVCAMTWDTGSMCIN
jgi:hypothetical protein